MNKFNEEFNSTCTDCPSDEVTEEVGADNQSLCVQQPSSSQVDPTSTTESETESSTIEKEPVTTEVQSIASEVDPTTSETEPATSETEPETSATEPATSESEPVTTEAEIVTSVLHSASEAEIITRNEATTAMMEETTESTGSTMSSNIVST